MYETLPIEALIVNSQNSSKIARMNAKKLRYNIECLSYYPTLTVRPHPTEQDAFEILDGHARLAALKELGILDAKCELWEADDNQAQLFLAVRNKLRGSEVPELRMNLLLNLLEEHTEAELAAHVPETKSYLTRLNQIADLVQAPTAKEKKKSGIVILSFYLSQSDRDTVNQAIRRIMEEYSINNASEALVKMAEMYLASVKSVAKC